MIFLGSLLYASSIVVACSFAVNDMKAETPVWEYFTIAKDAEFAVCQVVNRRFSPGGADSRISGKRGSHLRLGQ